MQHDTHGAKAIVPQRQKKTLHLFRQQQFHHLVLLRENKNLEDQDSVFVLQEKPKNQIKSIPKMPAKTDV